MPTTDYKKRLFKDLKNIKYAAGYLTEAFGGGGEDVVSTTCMAWAMSCRRSWASRRWRRRPGSIAKIFTTCSQKKEIRG